MTQPLACNLCSKPASGPQCPRLVATTSTSASAVAYTRPQTSQPQHMSLQQTCWTATCHSRPMESRYVCGHWCHCLVICLPSNIHPTRHFDTALIVQGTNQGLRNPQPGGEACTSFAELGSCTATKWQRAGMSLDALMLLLFFVLMRALSAQLRTAIRP